MDKKEILKRIVKDVFVEHVGIAEDEELVGHLPLTEYGVDSLDMVELVIVFEEMFTMEIPDESFWGESPDAATLDKMVDYLYEKIGDAELPVNLIDRNDQLALPGYQNRLNPSSDSVTILHGDGDGLECSPIAHPLQRKDTARLAKWLSNAQTTGMIPKVSFVSLPDGSTFIIGEHLDEL